MRLFAVALALLAALSKGSHDLKAFDALPTFTGTSFLPVSGSVGTPVTLSGTNFTGVTAVAFGVTAANPTGTSATFNFVSDTQITTAVPVGALTGSIAVTNGAGTTTSTRLFALPASLPVCFPTCSTIDGRMLAILGDDPSTFGGGGISLALTAPSISPTVSFGLFDGDNNAPGPSTAHWDSLNAPPLLIQLYADPTSVGAASAIPANLVMSWDQTFTSAALLDNDWTDLAVTNVPAALTASTTAYKYYLVISPYNPSVNTGQNAFKIRTSGAVGVSPQIFAFAAVLEQGILYPITDGSSPYPAAGSQTKLVNGMLTPTTYDGSWDFSFALAAGQTSLTVWDGDMDYGSQKCEIRDTHDLDSPAFPPFAVTASTRAEGIANNPGGSVSCSSGGFVTGTPPEDNLNTGNTGANLARRTPTRLGPVMAGLPNGFTQAGIDYEVVDPNGVEYIDTNPSGNLEWEQFKISTLADPNLPSPSTVSSVPIKLADNPGDPNRLYTDYVAAGTSLPAGIYHVKIDGMDIGNTNFWHFNYNALAQDPKGNPVPEDAIYQIAGTVWNDANDNGLDDGEVGVAGVVVTAVGPDGFTQTTTTDASGNYAFRVQAVAYTVTVGAANFGSGEPLNLIPYPTTNGNVHTVTANTDGSLTGSPNFGYWNNIPTTKPTPTITVTGDTKTYDGNPDNNSVCTVSGGAGNTLTYALSYSGIAPTTYGPTATAPTAAGTYTVTCTSGGDPNYTVVTGTAPVTINPRPLTVTAYSTSKTYGQTVTFTGSNPTQISVTPPTATTGLVGTDSVTSATLTSLGAGATATVAGGPYGIVITAASEVGSGLANYSITEVKGALTVIAATPTIKVTGDTKTYDGNPDNNSVCTVTGGAGNTLTYALSYSGIAPTTYGPTATAPTAAGTYTVTCTSGGDPNYGPVTGTAPVTINKAPLVITASSATVSYGSPVPTITPSYSGFVHSDTALTALTTAPTCTTVYTPTTPVASSPVGTSCSGATAANYSITYVAGTVTITGSVTVCDAGAPTTYTQGGWGAKPAGGNPGALLQSKFSAVYPGGAVQIGSTKTLRFTSAAAIGAFLPQGGSPAALTASAVNPSSSSAGVFGGQVLTLELNVDFSNALATTGGLGSQVLTSGKLTGSTVNAVLALANAAIGGSGTLPAGVSLSDLNDIVTAINQNYDGGTSNAGYLHSACIPQPPVCSIGYPFTSARSQTSVVFNESSALAGFTHAGTGANESIRVWYSDEHALALGVRQVNVKTSAGTATTNYTVTPLSTDPGSAMSPSVGATALTGNQAGTDANGRPIYPALFITDITSNPNALTGDWQYGGAPTAPSAVFGTWKAGVISLDTTSSPAADTITLDTDPSKNDWSLGSGSDPAPAGLTSQGYGAEVRWNVSDLRFNGAPLQTGHVYRVQFMVHDGDENKVGGDTGEGCLNISPGVVAPNHAPVAVGNAYSTKDASLTVAAPGLLANDSDPDGDAITAIKVTDPTNGTVTVNSDGSFTYTPTAGFNGTDSFTYKANDGTLDSNIATVTITVTGKPAPPPPPPPPPPPVKAPVAKPDCYDAKKNTALVVTAATGVLVNDTDPQGLPLTAALAGAPPAHGTVTLNADGSFTYTPATGFTGSDTFSYTASNGKVSSPPTPVTITVK